MRLLATIYTTIQYNINRQEDASIAENISESELMCKILTTDHDSCCLATLTCEQKRYKMTTGKDDLISLVVFIIFV